MANSSEDYDVKDLVARTSSVKYNEVDVEELAGEDIVVGSDDDDDDDDDFDPNNEFFVDPVAIAEKLAKIAMKAYKFAFGVCVSVKLTTNVTLKDMTQFVERGIVGSGVPTGKNQICVDAASGTFDVTGVKSGLSYLVTPRRRRQKHEKADDFRVVVVWHVYPAVKLAGSGDMVAVGIVTPNTSVKEVLNFIRDNERDIQPGKGIAGQGVMAIDMVRYGKRCETRAAKCQNSSTIVVGHLDQLKKEVVVNISRK